MVVRARPAIGADSVSGGANVPRPAPDPRTHQRAITGSRHFFVQEPVWVNNHIHVYAPSGRLIVARRTRSHHSAYLTSTSVGTRPKFDALHSSRPDQLVNTGSHLGRHSVAIRVLAPQFDAFNTSEIANPAP